MPAPYFSFKQFTVYHDTCAMKVGIDGVLLGAWTHIEHARTILDIGTGSGLVALMLAQRSNAKIVGIDIDPHAVLQAANNIRNSPWCHRVSVVEKSLQHFASEAAKQFDLIVSNPPYFVHAVKSPMASRTMARHTDSLTHEELIENALKLMKPDGRICLILPVIEGQQCVQFAESKKLHCTKQLTVFPTPSAKANRLLLEFSLIKSSKIETELTIESEVRHQYSAEFTALAKDFYLKL